MEQHRHADADSIARDRCDEGLFETGERLDEAQRREFRGLAGVGEKIGEIIAGGESPARAGKIDGAQPFFGGGFLQRRKRLKIHVARERVLLLGPIELDAQHAAFARNAEPCLHDSLPCWFILRGGKRRVKRLAQSPLTR